MASPTIQSVEPQVARRLGPASQMLPSIYRAAAAGLLSGLPILDLDEAALRQVIERIRSHGVAGRATHVLERALTEDADSETIALAWREVAEAIEASPLPDTEWRAALELFGADEVAPLVGVSPASLRRYASGERPTPQDAAERLHAVMIATGDLRSTYNDYGIRRWFQRPRKALGDRAPREVLNGKWSPDDREPRRVLELAAGSRAFVAT